MLKKGTFWLATHTHTCQVLSISDRCRSSSAETHC